MSFRSTVRGRGLSAWGAMLREPSFKTRVSSFFTWGSTETQAHNQIHWTQLEFTIDKWIWCACYFKKCFKQTSIHMSYTDKCCHTSLKGNWLYRQKTKEALIWHCSIFLNSLQVYITIVSFCRTLTMHLNSCLHIIKRYFNYFWLVVTGTFLQAPQSWKTRTPFWPLTITLLLYHS